jgi:hypothetical protein
MVTEEGLNRFRSFRIDPVLRSYLHSLKSDETLYRHLPIHRRSSIEEEVGSHIDGFWFLGAFTLIRVSTLDCVEHWRGTEYVPHGACVSGFSYVVSITYHICDRTRARPDMLGINRLPMI